LTAEHNSNGENLPHFILGNRKGDQRGHWDVRSGPDDRKPGVGLPL